MKNKLLLVALLVLACSLFVGWTNQKPSWEYHIEYHGTISEKKLNELGAQGWDLTSTVGEAKNGDTNLTAFYFKRAR